MFRVWYSNQDLARYIIENTNLLTEEANNRVVTSKMYESDANNSRNFHKIPTHLKRILYLDAPDIIIEKNDKPILSLEITTEAGTGHNAFQRFSRITAAVENEVPAFYIYPEAAYIYRQNRNSWDRINPLIFEALEKAMRIYNIPALLYYFPSHYRSGNLNFPRSSKGLLYDTNHPTCPQIDTEMGQMFQAINVIIDKAINGDDMTNLLGEAPIQQRRDYMIREQFAKSNGRNRFSPVTATEIVPTSALLSYLRQYAGNNYHFDGILPNRNETLIYKVDANFRGDPYPGALAALDYIKCRRGKSFEDRNLNLVLAWGEFTYDTQSQTININGDSRKSVNTFVSEVKKTYDNDRKILLGKSFNELRGHEIPRYFMQVRFGSTFTKVKHIRVYSYFCDAILFHDGALWREG